MRIICSNCSHSDVCVYKCEYNRLNDTISDVMKVENKIFSTELKCSYYTPISKLNSVMRNIETDLLKTILDKQRGI